MEDRFINEFYFHCIFLVAQQLYIPLRLYIFFSSFFSCPSMVHSMQAFGSCGGQWGAEGSQEGRGAPKPNQNWKSIPNQTKTQSYNLCLTTKSTLQPNQHWTAKPNQTGMAPQTKSELTIPSKPNQTVFNQTQSKEFYQSKLNQFKPKPYKQNKNQPNQTRPKPTKPNRI